MTKWIRVQIPHTDEEIERWRAAGWLVFATDEEDASDGAVINALLYSV